MYVTMMYAVNSLWLSHKLAKWQIWPISAARKDNLGFIGGQLISIKHCYINKQLSSMLSNVNIFSLQLHDIAMHPIITLPTLYRYANKISAMATNPLSIL